MVLPPTENAGSTAYARAIRQGDPYRFLCTRLAAASSPYREVSERRVVARPLVQRAHDALPAGDTERARADLPPGCL